MQQYQEQILFQHRTSTDGNEFVWQCPEFYSAIIKTLIVTETSGGQGVTYRLFARPGGGRTFLINNALAYGTGINSNAYHTWNNLFVNYPASIGIQSSAAGAIVITGFGILMKTG